MACATLAKTFYCAQNGCFNAETDVPKKKWQWGCECDSRADVKLYRSLYDLGVVMWPSTCRVWRMRCCGQALDLLCHDHGLDALCLGLMVCVFALIVTMSCIWAVISENLLIWLCSAPSQLKSLRTSGHGKLGQICATMRSHGAGGKDGGLCVM
eukprot:72830-Amphidinium_carterae.1